MTRPAWLGDRALKTRSDRPDDDPLEGPAQAQNLALERARAVQSRRLAGSAKRLAPGEVRRNWERQLELRRKVVHPHEETQRLAVRLWDTYRKGTGEYRDFGSLDNRTAIRGCISHKQQWWNVATEVLRIVEENRIPKYPGGIQA